MKNQRGVALSGLIFWGVVLALVALLGMKVAPPSLEYWKVMKGAKGTLAKMGPDATVADVRKTFDKFAEVDHLEFRGSDLDISKDGGQIVISVDYEKRIHLFWNVSLIINYKGSTAG